MKTIIKFMSIAAFIALVTEFVRSFKRENEASVTHLKKLRSTLEVLGGADMEDYKSFEDRLEDASQCAVCAVCGADSEQDGVFITLCGRKETIDQQVDPLMVREICDECELLMLGHVCAGNPALN